MILKNTIFRSLKQYELLEMLFRMVQLRCIWQKNKQNRLAKSIIEFLNDTRPKNLNMKKEKLIIKSSPMTILKGREMVYNPFRSRIFMSSQLSTDQSEKSERSSD